VQQKKERNYYSVYTSLVPDFFSKKFLSINVNFYMQFMLIILSFSTIDNHIPVTKKKLKSKPLSIKELKPLEFRTFSIPESKKIKKD